MTCHSEGLPERIQLLIFISLIASLALAITGTFTPLPSPLPQGARVQTYTPRHSGLDPESVS